MKIFIVYIKAKNGDREENLWYSAPVIADTKQEALDKFEKTLEPNENIKDWDAHEEFEVIE